MSTVRGIVISHPFTVDASGTVNVELIPPAGELRKYLLYWDKIDFAEISFMSFWSGQDIEFLIREGVATRTKAPSRGVISGNINVGEELLRAQQELFTMRDREQRGLWSIVQISTNPHFPKSDERATIEFELWNMLPVPKNDVPLADILEFKSKRQDELIALRAHLDDMYQSIISAADVPRARNTHMMKLELALRDIDRTLAEAGIGRALTSLRGFIADNAIEIGAFGISVYGLAKEFDVEPLSAASTGAAFAFSIKLLRLPAVTAGPQPLTYVSSLRKALK